MRRQLTLAAAAIATLIVLAFLIPMALLVRAMANDRALAAADQTANQLVPVLSTVTDRMPLEQVVRSLDTGDPSHLTVFLADGSTMGAATPPDEMAVEVEAARRLRKPLTVEQEGGTAVYQPVIKAGPGDQTSIDVVRSFVPDDVLHRGVGQAWAVLALLGLGLIGIATLVADRIAKSIVQPVNDLAATAESLSAGDLDARVDVGGPPEIVEVGHTLNQLAGRIDELLTAERESVADLSHRLRTPITALKLDAEGVRDDEERARLAADVANLQRAVDRLITEARRSMRENMGAASDLVESVRRRLSFWAVLAEDQGREYRLDDTAGGPVWVAVASDDLDAALDALLGNVLAHTPEGVPFRVWVLPDGTMVVEDDGHGFTGDHDELLTRGASGANSTGLGLDIVRQIAEASGGSLELGASASGGARVTVRFGLVDRDLERPAHAGG
jgi:signal transduction histidine kinase